MNRGHGLLLQVYLWCRPCPRAVHELNNSRLQGAPKGYIM